MSIQIDARNILRGAGILRVAAAAEFAGEGLLGAHLSRLDFVLERSLVAPRAIQQGVMRKRLCARDFAMARAALSRRV